MLNLGNEYLSATPSRKREIEQELIDMVPEDLKKEECQMDNELKDLHEQMKDELELLADVATKHDWKSYLEKLEDIQNKICDRARVLGVELERADLVSVKELVGSKFGKNETL